MELEEEAGHRGESKGLDQGSGMEDGSQDEQHHSLLCEADGARLVFCIFSEYQC